MRFQITADIEADCEISGPTDCQCGTYAIHLSLDPARRPTKIAIQVPIADVDAVLPQIIYDATPPRITVPDNPEAESILQLFKYLESLGSFWFHIRKIHWYQALHEWIPESPEERERLALHAIRVDSRYPEDTRSARISDFCALLRQRESLGYLTVPMSYYRVARSEYREQRNLFAFLNFYLFLEGLFAEGKTKTAQVEAAFTKASLLMEAAREAMSVLADERHAQFLRVAMDNAGCSLEPSGILKFLIRMRGRLSHYHIRDSRPRMHPLNEKQYQSLAFLACSVATHVVVRLMPTE